MKMAYKDLSLRKDTRDLINLLNPIIENYQRQGFMLSVRQLYYQLVARAVIENTERSYKRVASIINDGRLAGLIDWDAIEDRGRDIETRPHWQTGSQIVRAAANSFHMDMWDNQDHRVFIVVEKAALAGVLGGVSREFDVPLLAARGYPSVSIVREMALTQLMPAINAGQHCTVLHLGDHDPSGLDMTRDLDERFALFLGDEAGKVVVQRIALNMNQVDQYDPPPNPAKTTDARFTNYAKEFGDESWELDALEPRVLVDLVTNHINSCRDASAWMERQDEIEDIRTRLTATADDFDNAN